MTHQEIIDREIVEQYVLDQLSAGDRRIFQEHFFECDDCFQQAHNLSENLTRVRYAAAQGAMSRAPSGRSIMAPAAARSPLAAKVNRTVTAPAIARRPAGRHACHAGM